MTICLGLNAAVFSLKGWNKTAQGNALGMAGRQNPKP